LNKSENKKLNDFKKFKLIISELSKPFCNCVLFFPEAE